MSKKLNRTELHRLLEDAYKRFARPDFIQDDPIGIPHRYTRKEDIEIAGFLAATIAWGQRKTIISNASRLLGWMDNAPYDFILQHEDQDLKPFEHFVHRTFNGTDALYFIAALKRIYKEQGGLEALFSRSEYSNAFDRISGFHQEFFAMDHPLRTKKHVSNPIKGSSAKRLNMYLRWMVRSNQEGIDFGLWKNIPANQLMMPLDVHTGTQGRKLGILKRKQDDWKAVEELTSQLKRVDPVDPVRFDFALFGIGVVGQTLR